MLQDLKFYTSPEYEATAYRFIELYEPYRVTACPSVPTANTTKIDFNLLAQIESRLKVQNPIIVPKLQQGVSTTFRTRYYGF